MRRHTYHSSLDRNIDCGAFQRYAYLGRDRSRGVEGIAGDLALMRVVIPIVMMSGVGSAMFMRGLDG
ncbi:MAG TPA: hypothetical protein VFB99_06665 [Vicinamibacterales bacterium]|nr:hypothetical protein [Vicinamibacterales bacterium]